MPATRVAIVAPLRRVMPTSWGFPPVVTGRGTKPNLAAEGSGIADRRCAPHGIQDADAWDCNQQSRRLVFAGLCRKFSVKIRFPRLAL